MWTPEMTLEMKPYFFYTAIIVVGYFLLAFFLNVKIFSPIINKFLGLFKKSREEKTNLNF